MVNGGTQAIRCWSLAILGSAAGLCPGAEKPLVRLRGKDFVGGAAAVLGSAQAGMPDVNYVYARPTGAHATMKATFEPGAVPTGSWCLFVHGRDDDFDSVCPIEITLNDTRVASGPSGFPNHDWKWRRYPIAAGTLRSGKNELLIANTAVEGTLGVPPWFMVAECRIASPGYNPAGPPPIEEDFFVALPAEARPLPEPLPAGKTEPGFRIRGTKGWNWRPDQYMAEAPVLAQYKMNFLMSCYLSWFDDQVAWHSGKANRWWEPLPEVKKRAYEEVVRVCQRHGVEWCFAMNPNLASPRILDYDKPEDIDALSRHYDWMADLGVNWFSVCLDDISKGIDAKGQARAVNEILRRLRAKNPRAQMIFCPTQYWGTGESEKDRIYLADLAAALDPDVYVFWTGPQVVSPTIPRAAAEAYRDIVKHRLIIWDNYPVNDSAPTLHLGPVTGRDADLCEVANGFMSNPLCPQNEINRIPLLTIADYAFNPWGYDPARSVGQAIAHLARSPDQRRVLKDLVELYPGMLIASQTTGWNPVVSRFQQILAVPHSRYLAELYIRHVEDVLGRLRAAFPDQFRDAAKTVEANLATIKEALAKRYGR